ncbi:MAG: methyl-accepting chemotaxis protein [Cognaticolwellia sp.]|jgi:methyl-accepting chemotaxis protein
MIDAWIALNPMPEGIGALWNGLLIFALLLALSQHLVLMLRSASLRAKVRKLPHPIKSLRSLRDSLEPIGKSFLALEGATTHVRRGAEVQNGKLVLVASPAGTLAPDLLRQTAGGLVAPPPLLDRVPLLFAGWGLAGAVVSAAAYPQDLTLAASPLVWGLLCALIAGLFGAMATGSARSAIHSLVSWLELGSAPASKSFSPPAGAEDLMAEEDPDRDAMLLALEKMATNQQTLMEHLAAQVQAPTPVAVTEASFDPEQLQEALSRAIRSELLPVMAATRAAAAAGSSATIESVAAPNIILDSDAIARAVIVGLDGSIGDSLRSTADTLERVSKSQRSALGDWRDSVVGLTDLVQQLEQAGKSLAKQSEVISAASAPSLRAAETSLQASQELARIVPALENARTSWEASQTGVQGAMEALSQGTAAYRSAGELVQRTVSELQEAQRGVSQEMHKAVTSSAQEMHKAAATSAQEMHKAAATSAQQLQAASERSTASLEQATQASTAALTGQIDQALVASMKEAGSQLRRFAERQEQGLDSWQRGTTDFGKTVERLQGITSDLRNFSEGLAAATEPSLKAGVALERAATSLEKTVPSIEAAAKAQSDVQRSMQAAAGALQSGTDGYLSAAGVVKDLVSELQATHTQAIQRISQGIDEAVGDSLKQAGAQIKDISLAQAQQLVAWQESLALFTPAVDQLRGSAGSIEQVVERFHQAALPAASAAESFRQAAGVMSELVPKMDETTRSYEGMNKSLVRAARQLSESSRSYAEAGGEVASLVNGLQATLQQQVEGNKHFIQTVGQATGFIEALGPASQSVKSAARELEEASTHTADVVNKLKETVIVQGKAVTHMRDSSTGMVQAMADQRAQWERLMGDMDKLQDTMGKGMDTFSVKLPEAIDSTLVHFDAALGEGVERMGSSIERLREAMDDLQERLEIITADKRRNK